MNKLLKKQTGSAALIALLLTGAMSIMMLTMLERIIPASRNTKGIENSASATYVALSGVEESLNTLHIDNPGHGRSGTANEKYPISRNSRQVGTGSIQETASMIPMPGKGDSDFDKNWNKIAPGKPVQIFVTKDFLDRTTNLSDVKLDLRIPQLGSTGSTAGGTADTTFTTAFSGTIVNLTLTNSIKSLVPNYKCSGAEPGICNGARAEIINSNGGMNLGDIQAQILENSKLEGNNRLTNLLDTSNNPGAVGRLGCLDGCMLKLFIVNKIQTEAGNELPYLEYRLRKNDTATEGQSECNTRYNPSSYISTCLPGFSFTGDGIPLQHVEVEGVGRVGPFEQRFIRNLQQITTGDAFDFTVVQ